MKKVIYKDCTECDGTGTEIINRDFEQHPSRDEYYSCEYCGGTGTDVDHEAIAQIECRIEDVEWMIEGMLTRIRVTSDTIKDLNRGMFYELLPKYKHKLDIQSRALSRLELYLSTLKS